MAAPNRFSDCVQVQIRQEGQLDHDTVSLNLINSKLEVKYIEDTWKFQRVHLLSETLPDGNFQQFSPPPVLTYDSDGLSRDPFQTGSTLLVCGVPHGLSSVQLLKAYPMPALRYSPANSSNSTSACLYHPVHVFVWEEYGGLPLPSVITQHTAGVTAAGRFERPQAMTLQVLSSEGGPVAGFTQVVAGPADQVLRADTRPLTCCSASKSGFWTPTRTHQLTKWQLGLASFVPVQSNQKPDFELLETHSRESKSFVKAKKREVLEPAELCSLGLAPLWNFHVGRMTLDDLLATFPRTQRPDAAILLSACNRVVCVISQGYTHMCESGAILGAITTYDSTWLLYCPEPHTLMVSRRFGLEDSEPTPREAIYWLSHMALHEDGVRAPWRGSTTAGRASSQPLSRSSSKGAAGLPVSGCASSSTAADVPQLEQQAPMSGDQTGSHHAAAPCQLDKADVRPTAAGVMATGDEHSWLYKHSVHLPSWLTANLSCPLGSGVCGTVYQGWYTKGDSADREVAIKAALAAGEVQLLENETATYQRLAPAQGVAVPSVVCHGPGADGRGYYIATQRVKGQTLDAISRAGSLTPSVRDAALSALQLVHSLGVAHGDLREANILVDGSRVWLIDFSHASLDPDKVTTESEERLMRALCTL